jgi:alpha-L-fucosidase
MFYDFSYPGEDGKGRDDWNSLELMRLTRKLQPQILIDDRLDLLDVPGGWDYRTPEQVMLREQPTVDGVPVLWETCQTFSGSWGYHRDESSWKSVDQLVRMLIDTVSKGGNLLLNVGPTARGEFDARALDRLAGMGAWMKAHGRAIYGCGPAPEAFQAPQDCRLTYNAETHRLYVHVYAWPFRALHLDGFAGKVAYAQLLNDASELPMVGAERLARWGVPEDTLVLNLPVLKPDVAVPVVELFLK